MITNLRAFQEVLKRNNLPTPDTYLGISELIRSLYRPDVSPNPERIREVLEELTWPVTVPAGNPITFKSCAEVLASKALVTFAPKQSGTGDPSPTNVRLISGWDSLNLYRTAQQYPIVETDIYDYGINYQSANVTQQLLITDIPNGTYLVETNIAKTDAAANAFAGVSSKYNTYVTTSSDGVTPEAPKTVVVTDNKIMVAVRRGTSQGGTAVTREELANGTKWIKAYNTATKQTYNATFSDTVYGGTFDFVNGKLILTHKIVDLGSLTWSMTSTSGCFRTHGLDSLAQLGTAGQADAISTIYTNNPTARDVESLPDYSFCVGGSQSSYKLFLKDTRYTSESDFESAISGQKICYKLATPIEITLTPEDIELLKGTNTISTDGDTVTAKFQILK